MPVTTPLQKVEQVKMFGKEYIEIKLTGDTFDDSLVAAQAFSANHKATFIHPFDDPRIIEGQATVAYEILEDGPAHIDYLILPIGGGLAAGASSVFKILSPHTKIIGAEPLGAPSMTKAFDKKKAVSLDHMDKFVDGAAVKKVGEYTYALCYQNLDEILTVPEELICRTLQPGSLSIRTSWRTCNQCT